MCVYVTAYTPVLARVHNSLVSEVQRPYKTVLWLQSHA